MFFKKIFFIILALYFFIGANAVSANAGLAQGAATTTAEPGKVTAYFFWGDGCPHCAKEEKFLAGLKKELPYLEVRDFETWHNLENAKILAQVGKKLGLSSQGVPLTIVGGKVFSGYYSDQVTGEKIKEAIIEYSKTECPDLVGEVIAGEKTGGDSCVGDNCSGDKECADCQGGKDCEQQCGCETKRAKEELPDKINLPFFGEVEVKNFSLPVLTLAIAALDGFNPCAMWVLVFLIGLLLNMPNKKRMWVLGGSFIGASALVYFLFLAAWLNLFLFLGFIFWVRVAIGLVAVGSGIYNLREYQVNKEAVCKVTRNERRRRIFDRLKAVTQKESFWLALLGIIVLAFAVNLVELVCSAGLPAVYTNVLSLSQLPTWQYYGYLSLYVLIFMADDLLVFFVAMKTLQLTGAGHKYSRLSNLIGGIVILLLGLLLLFKPGWVMFG